MQFATPPKITLSHCSFWVTFRSWSYVCLLKLSNNWSLQCWSVRSQTMFSCAQYQINVIVISAVFPLNSNDLICNLATKMTQKDIKSPFCVFYSNISTSRKLQTENKYLIQNARICEAESEKRKKKGSGQQKPVQRRAMLGGLSKFSIAMAAGCRTLGTDPGKY